MALVNKAIPNITYTCKVKLRNDRMPYKHLVSKYLHSQVNFIPNSNISEF